MAINKWSYASEKVLEKYAISFEQTPLTEEIDEIWSRLREGNIVLQEMGNGLEKEDTITKIIAYQNLEYAVRWYP